MNFRSVYISRHAKVTTLSQNLIVQTNDETKTIPLDDIYLLILATPQVTISGMAVALLAQKGAKILFAGPSGQISAETMNEYSNGRSGSSIVTQVRWDAGRIAVLWTKIIGAKIQMQAQVATAIGEDASGLRNELEVMEINDTTNREAVVAKQYFRLLFGPEFTRESLDAVNAALNYGYTILLSHINLEVVANGALTEIGIHHHREDNKFNLGSDLMEPFRPVMDYWIYQHKLKELTPDIKIGLVDNMNTVIQFNGKKTLLRNANADYINCCLRYLNGETDDIQIEVGLNNEVSGHETDGNV